MPLPFILGAIGAVAGAATAAAGTAAAAATAAATTAAAAGSAAGLAAGAAGTAAAGLTSAAGTAAGLVGGAASGITGAASTAAGLVGGAASGLTSAATLATKGLTGITGKIVLSNAARTALATGAKTAVKIPWKEINQGIQTIMAIEQVRHAYVNHKIEEEELRRIRSEQANANAAPQIDPAEQARQQEIFTKLFQTQLTDRDLMNAFNEIRRKPFDMNNDTDWAEYEEFKKVVADAVAVMNQSC